MQQYASDPSADPQFVDESGITPTVDPSSDPEVKQVWGSTVSASGIASVESQLGVVAVYGLQPDGSVETNSYSLYTDSGQLASSQVTQEFNQKIDQVGVSEDEAAAGSTNWAQILANSEAAAYSQTTPAAEAAGQAAQWAANFAAAQDIVSI